MNIQLNRFWATGNSTISELVFGDFACYALELPWRNNATNESCIPIGGYKVVIAPSQRFGRDMPRLINVPGRSGILIHPGNDEHNTEGCILVGDSYSRDWVANSRDTFNAFFPLLQAELARGEVFINITRTEDDGA